MFNDSDYCTCNRCGKPLSYYYNNVTGTKTIDDCGDCKTMTDYNNPNPYVIIISNNKTNNNVTIDKKHFKRKLSFAEELTRKYQRRQSRRR